jgi:mutator protein MutT
MPALVYVAALAIIRRGDELLLVRRHPQHPHAFGGMWDMPGGRLEAGETPEQALLREIDEETSLQVRVLAPVSTWAIPELQLVGVSFACDYLAGEVRLTAEHTEYRWLPAEQAFPYLAHPGLVADLNAYLAWRQHWRDA